MSLVENFLNYVSMDTQSDPHSQSVPSTAKQLGLAKVLVKELEALGFTVELSTYGVVYAHIKGLSNKKTIGLIAHMDTSADASGADVKARIVSQYNGEIIALNDSMQLDPVAFPNLKHVIGHDLIVTDGTTLLGADDKAGIAIIMEVAKHVSTHLEDYGTLYIAFTPDEEIGAGTAHFEQERFPVEFAYTVDGSASHLIDTETFNAASAHLLIHGTTIHPGSAKGKMVHSLLIGMELEALLPAFDKPQYTQGQEGFYHLIEMQGVCEQTTMHYILRHHDAAAFAKQKQFMHDAVAFLNRKHGNCIELTMQDSYENMANYLKHDRTCVDLAKQAMLQLGIQPQEGSIRGGTDGARLSAQGLLTPHLGTGGYNFHGPYEYVSIQEMEQSVAIIKTILEMATR
ncbi:MAG: peptidase T [Erysipelotrichaceae bacterium]